MRGKFSIEETAVRAAALGYDGFDLAVRNGHPISPDNVDGKLAPAVQHRGRESFRCPLISVGVDYTNANADDDATKALLAATGDAGVADIKHGYIQFSPGRDSQSA